MRIFERSDDVLSGSGIQLRYDIIILDESESLLAHFEEQTMGREEIGIWDFFDELLKHSGNMLLMDGDISDRLLSFASAYGEMTYINNNTGAPRTINLMLDEGQWQTQLDADLARYYNEDPRFRVCIVIQSSTKVVALESELKARYPHLNIKSLIGSARRSDRRSRASTRPWRTPTYSSTVRCSSPAWTSRSRSRSSTVCSAPIATRSGRSCR